MNSPQFPSIGTMPSRAGALLLTGHRITHRDFLRHAATYRLSAYIFSLRQAGWPVQDHFETVPTSDPTKRDVVIKRYYLTQEIISAAGEAGQDYARKVKEWEVRAAGTVAADPAGKTADLEKNDTLKHNMEGNP